ncbi:hypothetical protein F5050DRAFT_579433 [Lentinula boryana]|uniref:MFS general substrate transporter n=1 Tax=Lentinula boryana TaxID=40481 RepID=A0ABQ8Q6I9_9AGAR|nr:hypothetical protein F5050DRAFT_579433 [Lentinula boryana]
MTNIVGSTIIITLPPFPVFILALFINGIGACIYDASFATYTAYFDEGPAMSLLFAAFGVGALIAPLIVAAMLVHRVSWNINIASQRGRTPQQVLRRGSFPSFETAMY